MYGAGGGNGSLPAAERQLVEGLRAGRPEAFERLVAQYGRQVEAVARQLLRDPDAARDVAQEVYLAVFRGIHRFEARARLGSWIHRIAVNRALVELRRRRRRPEVLRADPVSCDRADETAECPVGRIALAQAGSALDADLARLRPLDREVVRLRLLEDQSTAETARRLGISPGAVKSRLHRVCARLRGSEASVTRPDARHRSRHAKRIRSRPPAPSGSDP